MIFSKGFLHTFTNISWFALFIPILIVYFGNVVQVKGDVVAAAQAAASIDNQRYNYQQGSKFPVARPPQRRQYYHRTRPQYYFPHRWFALPPRRYQQSWSGGSRRQVVKYPSSNYGSSSSSYRNPVRRQRVPSRTHRYHG